ncbi:vacuolar protein sorting/targeting protein 10 [Aspergillus mulundensis]|uniref:Vacuolar protein sorting/targeting protein 10 n=1 Tax=Aspergillus mulundensis TaxID=1810919 RepID=A0A3D8QR57_9EURO|nr:Vacuolar protein sorting protein 10 [Aspergillus mulundensis]RDW64289.1 Vacuolar protein sorting protein 10 [Aspergillus mulundensis]
MISRWYQFLACLVLALWLPPSAAKKEEPGISRYELHDKPYAMFYFEKSDTVLLNLDNGELLRSFDAGEHWEVIEEDGMKQGVTSIYPHPFDNNKAYALGREGKHWMTTDKAKTWKPFEIPDRAHFKSPQSGPLSFHGRDSSKVIFETRPCVLCTLKSYYTTDDFGTIKVLTESAVGCYWGIGNPLFGTESEVSHELEKRTICVVPGLKASSTFAFRLVYSDDYFSSQGIEAKLQDGRPVSGVTSVAQVKRFMVAAVESQGTTEKALYVTTDTEKWHRADFGDHRLEENSYTILESTNYSLQVDVLTDKFNGIGVLFTSNSDGTYFTRNIEHTNRGRRGLVDFEKLAVIQGIVLVNTVRNPSEVEGGSRKEVVSQISFDDGRTFQPLKVHLHSVNSDANLGRVFSSPAPGLVMGIGNAGDYLGEHSEGDLYVSDDAGITWRLALKGPHLYEIGDQGAVLVAISDAPKVKTVEYSLDHGKEWKSVDLPHEIDAITTVTTTPDSTSLKFIVLGHSKGKYCVYSIDFEDLHERKCEDDDFDMHWPARLTPEGNPDCLMGSQQFFRRRKASADCFVAEAFNSSMSIFEPCKCTAEDFECQTARTEDGKGCVPPKSFNPPDGTCSEPSDTFLAPSGWRLIPGDVCIREGGVNLDKEDIDLPCKDVKGGAKGKDITSTQRTFKSDVSAYRYLERQVSNIGEDETIILHTTNGELLISHDHGKTWQQKLKGTSVTSVIPHQHFADTAYFLTDSEEVFYTINRGVTFESFKTKKPPSHASSPPLRIHPSKRDWLLWVGEDCDSGSCHSNAYFSDDRGDSWKIILRHAKRCEFEYRENQPDTLHLVFCEQYENEDESKRLRLMSTNDEKFSSEWEVVDENIVSYATRPEYIILASRKNKGDRALKARVSVDGVTFADLKFPPNVVPDESLYTVLDTSEHAIFLYVEANNMTHSEYGSLVKSNSNGTTYVLSLDSVNQNTPGYVDFERMRALEGVIIANIVSNVDGLPGGAPKKLRTMITHNDGGEWTLLTPPAKNADGEKFSCSVAEGKGTKSCALHLHGYTERADSRDTFSSGSAIGLMMGLGNVGDVLTSKDEADTFMTQDGGITWKSVKKGRYMWEYGDSGSVIAIVPEQKSTKVLHYSTDEGTTWRDYEFSDEEIEVFDISTVPSDTSKNFLLWGKRSGELVTINVDFSGLYDRDCEFDKGGDISDDYELWNPKHPFQENNCLFGHVEQYRRKKTSAECWNNWRGPHLHSIESNCTCTTADYECDYNFERQNDGTCQLVTGLEPQDPVGFCKAHPEAVEYWKVTGYRRIPQTTCHGGSNLDHQVSVPCPGKQEEYDKKHGISGTALFFAIVTPIALAGAVGYFVYTRWDGKFGQIRLGESSTQAHGFFSRDSALITIPITIIAGVVAIAKTLPLLATSLWRSASGHMRIGRNRSYPRPYASRASFAARRGDYSSVVDDEDELLGVEDFEGDEEEEA